MKILFSFFRKSQNYFLNKIVFKFLSFLETLITTKKVVFKNAKLKILNPYYKSSVYSDFYQGGIMCFGAIFRIELNFREKNE